jgi:hypothetical protein
MDKINDKITIVDIIMLGLLACLYAFAFGAGYFK